MIDITDKIDKKMQEYEKHFDDLYSMFMSPNTEEEIIKEIDYCIKNNIGQYEKVKAEYMATGMTEEEFEEIYF